MKTHLREPIQNWSDLKNNADEQGQCTFNITDIWFCMFSLCIAQSGCDSLEGYLQEDTV